MRAVDIRRRRVDEEFGQAEGALTVAPFPPSFRGDALASNPDSGLTLRVPRNDAERPVHGAMRKLPVVHISSCAVGQITTMLPRVSLPQEGRFAIVTDVGSGMRWPRGVIRRMTRRGRRNRVVLAPPRLALNFADDA